MVTKEEMAPHVEDIARALGKERVLKEGIDIEKELRDYVETYRVLDIGTAKRSIVRKHGGNPTDLRVSSGPLRSLAELQVNEPSVDFVVRVVTVNPKEIEVEGQKRRIHYGIIADATASKGYTAWMEDVPFQKGDVIRVRGAYTKDWNGEPQINFGNRATFEKLGDNAIPPGASARFGEERILKVREFRDGESNVTVKARVLSVERREVTVGDAVKPVFSGLLADETGRAQYTMWHDFRLRPGEAVRIQGAYIKCWRGIPRLTFDERSRVERLEESSLPALKELERPAFVTIEEVAARGGAADVTLRGIIIDVKPGSGLVQRCPECRRVTRGGVCRVHGAVQGEPDLRIKAALDDGTGAVIVVLGRELTEKVTGKTMEEYRRLVAELANPDAVRADIMEKVIARPMELSGNVTSDEYGLMLIATSARLLEVDVQAEAKAMLEELGVG
ncbi:MAG: hypothetical protein ACUVV6_02290 [Thermoplasmatota archaeon]